MFDANAIGERLATVRGRIDDAARRAGRTPGGVTLVLASKTQPNDALAAAYRAGAREFGENYVQEAMRKREALGSVSDVRWHLIGHLQTNKAKLAVRTFDLIQSLDSARLAQALGRAQNTPRVRALIEVNVGGEITKSGIAPTEVEQLIDAARETVDLAGLMTIPPPTGGPTRTRRYFAQLRELRGRLAAATGLELSELSMGMTDDYEVAVEEGATIVRVGRAVFGERQR
ncbi:MAG: YggS family pyridoxal phosphate-dependent enzyme [Candidatus Binataceae bacterium]